MCRWVAVPAVPVAPPWVSQRRDLAVNGSLLLAATGQILLAAHSRARC